MKIKYNSNNSGGYFWLKSKDWKALEDAGWNIDKNNTFFGTFMYASKEFITPRNAILEFERLTGQDAGALGCTCCGPPHEFSWDDENGKYHCVSGPDIYEILFDKVCSKRELLEYINQRRDEQ